MDGIIAFVVAFGLLLAVAIVGAFMILNVVAYLIALVKACDPHAPESVVEEVE